MIDAVTQRFLSVLGVAGVTGDPCDEWQVRDLEQQLQVALPPAYKAFLLLAGRWFEPFEGSQYILEHDGGKLLQGAGELQRAGRGIAQRDGKNLPADSFVFFVHQGVAVRFFLMNDGDNPAVYEYVEHQPPAAQVAASLSEFLLGEVRESARVRGGRAEST